MLCILKKNVFESVIGTLLNIKGKYKDGLKAREDMVEMEKKILCKFLSEVKVPEGYSSDIRRLVSMKYVFHNFDYIAMILDKTS